MSQPTRQPDLDSLVAALEGTFPAQSDATLAITLLRLLAQGDPVTPHRLGEKSGRAAAEVTERLAAWSNVERDADGSVVAFAGLSLRRTRHTFVVGGRRLFTWCAWDTLFLPELLGRTASVRSTCPATDQPVSMTVSAEGAADLSPVETVVSVVVPHSTDDIRTTFCCNVMFLASADAGRAWTATRANSALLSVEEAHELGRRANSRFFPHAKRPTEGATA